jgi:hypothetical protein
MKPITHKPSPAMVIALLALFVALGGAGMAATGGNFILGQSNSANQTTALSSGVTTGPTLSLTNTGGKPAARFSANSGVTPFSVSNATRVPSLNADLLDGFDSTYFLPKTGTAANSAKLGGQLPGYYLPTTGKAADSDKLDGIDSTQFQRVGLVYWGAASENGEVLIRWNELGATITHDSAATTIKIANTGTQNIRVLASDGSIAVIDPGSSVPWGVNPLLSMLIVSDDGARSWMVMCSYDLNNTIRCQGVASSVG